MLAQGWIIDGTHPEAIANSMRGRAMLDQIGFTQQALNLADNLVAARAYASDRIVIGDPLDDSGSLRRVSVDISFYLGRALNFRDAAGTTFANFDSRNGSGNPSSLPAFSQVGAGFAGFVGNGTDVVNVRRWSGSNMNSAGYIAAAAFLQSVATQSLATNGAVTFTPLNGGIHRVALAANATSSTIGSPATNGHPITICWAQDATGGRTYAWPGNTRFAGGAPPSDTTPNTMTTVTFFYDNSSGRWVETSRSVAVPLS